MKGKHFAKAYWSRTRIVSAILSVALLFGCITFTSAWLIAEDKEDAPMVNKFTGSKLEIELLPEQDQGTYRLIPGESYNLAESEIPQITIKQGSVKCYLFVVIEETDRINNLVSANGTNTIYFSNHINGLSDIWDYTTIGDNSYGSPDSSKVNQLSSPNDCTNITVLVPSNKNSDLNLGIVDATQEAKKFTGTNTITIKTDLAKNQVHPNYFGDSQPIPKIKYSAYAIQTLGFEGKYASPKDDLIAAWNVVQEAIKSGNTKEVVLE